MTVKSRGMIVLLAVLVTVDRVACAQQRPTSHGSSQQPATTASPANQQQAGGAVADQDDALENVLLEEADEEHITYMDSHIALKYNHDEFEEGSSLDQVQVHWLQASDPQSA
jgi:hypothetical protein